MAVVLDTSFLIALEKMDQLNLIGCFSEDHARLISKGAQQELSQRLVPALDRLDVHICDMPAATVDNELLALAWRERAVLFSNDGELRRRARSQGLVAFGPEDFFFQLLCQRVIRPNEYRRLIVTLQAKNLISRKRMAQYLNLEP
jgi:hypothetical protein